jgi:hypothetical protein
MTYQPKPIDTGKVKLPTELEDLTEKLAEHVHDIWAQRRLSEGWIYGPDYDETKKIRPDLVSYQKLSEQLKDYDRSTALETIKAIIALGYSIKIDD